MLRQAIRGFGPQSANRVHLEVQLTPPSPAWVTRKLIVGTWLSLVERTLGVGEVASSNLVVPTIYFNQLDSAETSSSRRADVFAYTYVFSSHNSVAKELALVLFDGKTHELHGFKQVMSHGFLRRGGVTFLDSMINRQMVLQNSRRDAG